MNKVELRSAIRNAGLSGKAVCAHTSLSSFGHVEGGADALIDAFLDEGCTLVVPSFSYAAYVDVDAPEGVAYENNNYHPDPNNLRRVEDAQVYYPDEAEVSSGMGAVPRAVFARAGRVRGNHPLNSICAVGPLAGEIIAEQTDWEVYGPYAKVAALGGAIALMGVGLNRCTPLHWAEQLSGRGLFIRWYAKPDGSVGECRIGSCSSGFENFAGVLAPFERQYLVGESAWRVFPMKEAMEAAARAIRENPSVTRCDSPECGSCEAMAAGGVR